MTVDDECTALAFAPDGRIAYSARHLLKARRYEMQRDDIWLVGADGKRKRILNGEKLVRSSAPFSYTVGALRWSPDGHSLTAELLTMQVTDLERGDTRDGVLTLLLDGSGKEIRIAGADSVIPEAINGAWLADGVTVVYMAEAVQPKLLYSIHSVRPVAGRGGALFADRVFVAAAWNAKQNTGVAVERDRSLSGPPRLVKLDLMRETVQEIATLDGFAGGLTLSPSGTRVAYYRDHETLEIRDLAAPARFVRLRVIFGLYQWEPGERRILLKRSSEHKSADLVWFDVPALADPPAPASAAASGVLEPSFTPALHALSFRDFELSPDGRFLAVIQPGKRNLLVYLLR